MKPKNTSNKVLIIMFGFIFLFVFIMIITYWVKGGVPDTLIQYTLGAGGVECLMLAGIKITKVWKGDKSDKEDEDD